MIDSVRRLFHPTTIMAFQELLELTPGTLFVAGTVLHVKIEPLGPGNAILPTGARDARDVRRHGVRGRRRPQKTPGSGDLVGRRTEPAELLPRLPAEHPWRGLLREPLMASRMPTAKLQSAPALVQLDALASANSSGVAQTPLALPATF